MHLRKTLDQSRPSRSKSGHSTVGQGLTSSDPGHDNTEWKRGGCLWCSIVSKNIIRYCCDGWVKYECANSIQELTGAVSPCVHGFLNNHSNPLSAPPELLHQPLFPFLFVDPSWTHTLHTFPGTGEVESSRGQCMRWMRGRQSYSFRERPSGSEVPVDA